MPAQPSSPPRRSVRALAVLSMLTEAPTHAYRMQPLIKERLKDDVINVTQRNSIYQTIERLVRDGLAEIESTMRPENARSAPPTGSPLPPAAPPCRKGRSPWCPRPGASSPSFPGALAFLPNLSPQNALGALTTRVTRLEERLAAIDGELAEGRAFLPRLFLESEYQPEVFAAELTCVRTLVSDLAVARLTWPAACRAPITPRPDPVDA